jgi:hypothetical protein
MTSTDTFADTWTMTFEAVNCPDMPDVYSRETHDEHLWKRDGFTVYCPGLD